MKFRINSTTTLIIVNLVLYNYNKLLYNNIIVGLCAKSYITSAQSISL